MQPSRQIGFYQDRTNFFLGADNHNRLATSPRLTRSYNTNIIENIMDAHANNRDNVPPIVAEVIQGLHEFQMVLVDSAGKVTDTDVARKLYMLADEHGAVATQLRHMAGNSQPDSSSQPSPFLNQIYSLGARLRKFGDFSKSQLLLCEIIQTEDRMIRRFRVLIEQVSDIKWRRRLARQLDHLLDVREGLSRFGKCSIPKTDARASTLPSN